VALAGLLPALHAFGLDPARAVTQHVHDVWETADGLPQNSVTSIVRGRDGYLWFGTQAGLTRFDGVRFTVYDRRSSPSLAHNYVLTLLEDRDGRLWVGTAGGGLSRMEGGRFRHFTRADGLPADEVKSLMQDRQGRLWVGTIERGLARLQGERFVRVAGTEPIDDARVRQFVENADGSVWIATSRGLFLYQEHPTPRLTPVAGLPDEVTCLVKGRDGSLWIGTSTHGIVRLLAGRRTSITARDGLSSDRVMALHEDRQGVLWVGTLDGGLNRVSPGRIATFTSKQGLSSDSVMSIAEDAEGSLWVGTAGGGLNRLRDGRMTPFGVSEGFPSDQIGPFHEDDEGTLWMGTARHGVGTLRDGRFVPRLSRAGGLLSDDIWGLWRAREGGLWIGTDRGVNLFKDGRLRSFGLAEGLSDVHVAALLEDDDGVLWVATERGGLNRFRNGRIDVITTREGLSHDNVFTLCKGGAGRLWAGTLGGGVTLLQHGRVERSYTTRDGLASDYVVALHEDAEGTLWIGTRSHGLSRLRDGRIASVGGAAGMFDAVQAILEDGAGKMWFMSNVGLARVDRTRLEAVLDGREPRLEMTVFGKPDGMRSTEGASGYQSALRTRGGHLWIATLRGAVRIDPGRAPDNALPPPVVIEGVLADGRPLAAGEPIRVAPGVRSIEVRYTGLSLRVPDRVRFRYRLLGYDDEWVDAADRRVAFFTGVPHGDYRFQVVAANDDGLWNEQGASIAFSVAPRWHETAWFRLLAALSALVVVYGGYRLRVLGLETRARSLALLVEQRTASLREAVREAEQARNEAVEQRQVAERANRAKTAFLANMSHELRTPLNAVLGFAQLMARRRDRAAEDLEHLGIIGRSGEHLLGLINDVLSLSKIEAGVASPLEAEPFEPASLLEGLVQMLAVRAEAKGLDLRLELPAAFPRVVEGDLGKLRQILLNLLGNAVKFTAEGGVVLRAAWNEGTATFAVEDTGPGMTEAELGTLFQPFVQTSAGQQATEGTGLGLAISRGYARLMGGDITAASVAGRGTVFTLALPLPVAPGLAPQRGERRRVVGIAGGARPRVLVVDDVADNRLLLSRLLSAVGFVVSEAAGGHEALRRWDAERPDLIFMDMRMPGLDGMEATRRIRAREAAQPERPRCRIVALSASVLEHERQDVFAAGCDDFLPKPFREGALFDKAGQVLGLTYEYEGPPATPAAAATGRAAVLTPERVGALEAGVRERLRAAIRLGDDQEALAVIEEVGARDPELASALASAVREYQIARLLTLMEQVRP
jgi:signal transduction histidine kinase/ligand-binding sensor domain-containing protein/CheY-like chemotaxis protein